YSRPRWASRSPRTPGPPGRRSEPSSEGLLHRRARLLDRRLRDRDRILLPVLLVEELDREVAGEADRLQVAEERRQRRDAVARIDAVLVLDRLARRIGGIVVRVDDVDR